MAMASNLFSLLLLIKLVSFISGFDSTAAKTCQKKTSCSPGSIPIRFPFRLLPDDVDNGQRCGYPGFELRCNHTEPQTQTQTQTQTRHSTMIWLPSGEFTVRAVSYDSQTLTVDDPAGCLPNRFLNRNFSLVGSPFRVANLGSYTFLNCSARVDPADGFEPVPCLSGEGYTVVARPTALFETPPAFCEAFAAAMVPVPASSQWWAEYSWRFYLRASVGLAWDEPRCRDCELRGGECGFSGEVGSEIGCFDLPKHGLSKGSQYALYFIAALAVLGFFFFNCRVTTRWKCTFYTNHGMEMPRLVLESRNNTVFEEERSQTRRNGNINSDRVGSSGPEETPKSLVGESKRLLSSKYTACPICLSDYRKKDKLRTLPDCLHYFHSDCIDEWLRMNPSCPLCRHSPFVSPLTVV